jgi:Putative addiction module component
MVVNELTTETLAAGRRTRQASAMQSPRVRAVLGLVSELSDDERSELRAELDGALSSSPEEWDRAWNDELSRRMAQVESGEVELVDGDQVMADLRDDLTT